jgi:hypothetical protein
VGFQSGARNEFTFPQFWALATQGDDKHAHIITELPVDCASSHFSRASSCICCRGDHKHVQLDVCDHFSLFFKKKSFWDIHWR